MAGLVGRTTLSYQMTEGEARGLQTPPRGLPSRYFHRKEERDQERRSRSDRSTWEEVGQTRHQRRPSPGPAHFQCSAGNLALICCSFTRRSLVMGSYHAQLPS